MVLLVSTAQGLMAQSVAELWLGLGYYLARSLLLGLALLVPQLWGAQCLLGQDRCLTT